MQLVWHRNGYWVHIAVEKPALKKVEGGKKPAAIDPGEIHAVTITDGQEALVISGGFFGLSTACGTRSCVGFSGPYPGRRRDHVGGGSCWMPSTDS
ncbi:MAG TPA: hypothetical protein VMW83_15080 [Spirochaetia bacterium]|nr:hypothetical protein [Spirochaetia bacterium]